MYHFIFMWWTYMFIFDRWPSPANFADHKACILFIDGAICCYIFFSQTWEQNNKHLSVPFGQLFMVYMFFLW